jgi:hypothetical protein
MPICSYVSAACRMAWLCPTRTTREKLFGEDWPCEYGEVGAPRANRLSVLP